VNPSAFHRGRVLHHTLVFDFVIASHRAWKPWWAC
jgi:hypothetical protein